MDAQLSRQLRFLKAYAVISSIALGALFLLAAANQPARQKFEEIDVERINVVEHDGKLRLVISNNERSPAPVIGGFEMKTRAGKRGAGLIFFNDEGNECGGMTWSAKSAAGKVEADSGLMFDQYNQDQTVGITYAQEGEQRSSGLRVWERSLTPIADFARQVNDIEMMTDGPEKTAAMKKLREQAAASGMGGAQRVFVGRNAKDEAVVSLAGNDGKPRILLSVDAMNAPKLQFLDAEGKVTFSVPAASPK